MKIIGQLKAILGLDKGKFDRGLSDAERKTNRFSAGIKRLAGFMAAAFSIGMIVNFAKKIGLAYDVQARAERSLLVALKGREDIQQSIIRQAQSLQRITLFGDEQTIEAASHLAMIIGTNEAAIKRLIPLVQDLAVAQFQGNLVTAADMVAKSVGSSTNALSRYGIQIEGTVGSVDRLESAIKALNRQVGGQAEAAAEVGISAFTQFGNLMGDIMEQIGKKPLESKPYKGLVGFGKNFVEILQEEDKGFLQALWQSWFRREKTLKEIEEKIIIPEEVTEGTKIYIKTIADLNQEIADYNDQLDQTAISDKKTIDSLQKKIKLTEQYLNLLLAGKIYKPGTVTAPVKAGGIPAIPSMGTMQQTLAAGPSAMITQTEDMTRALTMQNEAVSILANSFNALFSSGEKGWEAMINSMIADFKRLIAEIAAKIAVLTLIRVLFPGTNIGASATTGLMNIFGSKPFEAGMGTAPAVMNTGAIMKGSSRLDVAFHGVLTGNVVSMVQRRSQLDN